MDDRKRKFSFDFYQVLEVLQYYFSFLSSSSISTVGREKKKKTAHRLYILYILLEFVHTHTHKYENKIDLNLIRFYLARNNINK